MVNLNSLSKYYVFPVSKRMHDKEEVNIAAFEIKKGWSEQHVVEIRSHVKSDRTVREGKPYCTKKVINIIRLSKFYYAFRSCRGKGVDKFTNPSEKLSQLLRLWPTGAEFFRIFVAGNYRQMIRSMWIVRTRFLNTSSWMAFDRITVYT